MRYFFLVVLIHTIHLFTHQSSLAQTIVKGERSGIRQEVRIDEHTRLFDKTSGKQISYQEYRALIKDDPFGYHLEPIIDEYGQASAYKIRPTTAEERETHSFKDFESGPKPKIGEPVPEFIMKGIDDKVYRSTALKGNVIVLSFWISLSKPFWGPNHAKLFADALHPYQSETGLISLGILQESKEAIVNVMATETLPFIPVPNSYGFNRKFQITTGPSFMVIDRSGNLAALVEGSEYDELRKALQTVSR
ncbi:hypothetical protein GO755_25740 [Spirosoma sp. HMF4905]|uniref:Thioredoxin domain-containing protein n=1 Tax=Spirosoma arboris TaxID=2682092 RepID=A0A7K1SI72_9BACT|nr:hypothetical protein [Spirosoma arboris]MVM33465.1 hypothetical protein [Spirosoma arboris]